MVKMDVGSENIFNITQPERYRCQMIHYHNRLSRLYISVMKEQNPAPAFYLLFSDVGYMDCPVNWQGVNFRIAQSEECLELMLSVGIIGQAILQFPNAYASITDYARLFIMETSQQPIRIIASGATQLRQLPDLG